MALTSLDRCDRCTAQAFVRFHFPEEQELQFCRHHAKKYEDTLLNLAIDVEDETHRLLARPTAADGST
jgi:hypothetical protein